MSGWILEGLTALISGMSAVFLILILISLMINGLGHVGKLQKKETHIIAGVSATKPNVQSQSSDDEERRRVVAAITVALAQELNVSADQLIIRKFRRL